MYSCAKKVMDSNINNHENLQIKKNKGVIVLDLYTIEEFISATGIDKWDLALWDIKGLLKSRRDSWGGMHYLSEDIDKAKKLQKSEQESGCSCVSESKVVNLIKESTNVIREDINSLKVLVEQIARGSTGSDGSANLHLENKESVKQENEVPCDCALCSLDTEDFYETEDGSIDGCECDFCVGVDDFLDIEDVIKRDLPDISPSEQFLIEMFTTIEELRSGGNSVNVSIIKALNEAYTDARLNLLMQEYSNSKNRGIKKQFIELVIQVEYYRKSRIFDSVGRKRVVKNSDIGVDYVVQEW